MKLLKFLLLTLSALTLVLLVTLSVVLIQPNWFKQPLNRIVEHQTGLQLSVASMDSGIRPASFSIRQISLKNADGEALFDAENIGLELQGWPSLAAPFFTLSITAPHVRYQLDENGRSNWPAGQPDDDTSASGPESLLLPADFSFYRIAVDRGQVDIDLPAQKRRITLPMLQLERSSQDKAQLQLVTEIDGERFELEGDFQLVSEQLLGVRLGVVNPSVETLLDASLSTRPQLNGSDGQLELSLHSTDFLSRLLGTDIPRIPGASFSAHFSVGDHYRLSDLLLKIGKQSLTGSADYSPVDNHLTLDLKSERLALDELLAAINESTDDPQQAEAELAENASQAVERAAGEPASEESAIDWSSLRGIELDANIRIDDFSGFGWTGTALSAHTVLRNKGNKAPKLAIAASGKQIRNVEQGIDLDSLSLESDLAALGLNTRGADADIDAKVVLNESIQFKAEGSANLNGVADQSFRLDFNAAESAELWQLAGLPFAEAGALSVKGVFESEQSTFKPDLTIALGEQQLDIEVAYTPAGENGRPYISVTANGRNLDTRFTRSPETASPATEEKAATEKLFSEEPIDTEFLRSFDADLSLDIKKLVTDVNVIDQLSLIAQLKDGRLTTRESRLKIPDNDLSLSLSGDFRKDTSKAQIELKLKTKNAGNLGLEQAAKIKGGNGNVTIKLKGEGISPHAIAASLDGSIDAKLQDMTMENKQLDLVGSDILSEVIGKLNPFAKSDPVTHLECVSVHFDADKGVLDSDKALHVETRKMKIIGNGQVDLGKEQLSLNFTPIARKGLGVNLSYLVKLVKIQGDIQSPGIGVDAGGLVNSALTTSAAMATGGVSLIAQSLLERATNAGSACDPDKKLELDIPDVSEQATAPENTRP
ncbi:MAG TPA: hypothetical protein DIW43_04950 [Spongiibacteraceae bacterium]|nr:hypothetical protein [Spongiibacteraceae bacterium]HCS26775.1 hypothetical protein [Spongiibacteraceae bacterium]